jgi:hypothetical protein
VGFVSGMFGDNLKTGIIAALIFPAMILVGVQLLKREKTN